jgi:hypothetical protein
MESTEYDYSRNAPEPLLTNGMRFVFYTVPQPVLETFNNIPQFFIDLESKEKGEDKKEDIRVYVRFEPIDVEDPDARKALTEALSDDLIAHLKKCFRKYKIKEADHNAMPGVENLRPNSKGVLLPCEPWELTIATLLDAVDQTDVWVQSKRKSVRDYTILEGQIGLDCLTELVFNFTSKELYMEDPTLPISVERENQTWDCMAAVGYATLFGVKVIYWITRPYSERFGIEGNAYRKFVTAEIVANAVNHAVRQSFDKYNRPDVDTRTYIDDVTTLDVTTF